MATLYRRNIILTVLLLVFAFAVDSMWLLLFRNTYMATLARIRDVGPRYLPGSGIPIRSRYTGITILDYWFAVMQTILANVTDGSAPRLSLFGFHFAGQLCSIVTILMMEAMRDGNKWTLLRSFMPWGLAMTAYGYAVVMPLYGIFHILVSSTALATTSNSIHVVKQIQILDYPSLYTLPNAILLGYGLPVLFMALPVFSTNLHQLFVAGWHLFPIWVSLSQFLLTSINNYALTITMLKVDMTETQSKELDLDRMHRTAREMSLRRAYRFAYMTSASTHVFTLFVIALAKLFPSFLTSSTDQSVSWSGVFLPDYWRSMAAMKSFVQGTLNLLQYDQYAGSLGAITWGIGLYSLSVGQHLSITGWINLVTDVLATSVAFGPAAALTLLMSRRDQEINGLVPPDLRHNISKTDPSNRMETSRH